MRSYPRRRKWKVVEKKTRKDAARIGGKKEGVKERGEAK